MGTGRSLGLGLGLQTMSRCTVLPMLRKKKVSGINMLSLIFNPQLKDFLFSFP